MCNEVSVKEGYDFDRVFSFHLVFDLSFALSLSKGRPFMVRQAHHERTTLVTLNNEETLITLNLYQFSRQVSHPHPSIPPSRGERGSYFTLTPTLSLRERGSVDWRLELTT